MDIADQGSKITHIVEDGDIQEVIHVAEFRASLRSFLRLSERVARESGLTPQRHLLLLMIKGAPDGSERATITQLANRMRLQPHSVTELVARAESAGLIERATSSRDRRVVYLRLTAEGERRLLSCFHQNAAERRLLTELLA